MGMNQIFTRVARWIRLYGSLMLGVVALAALIWMGRYQVIGTGGGYAKLDRWTGVVYGCGLEKCYELPRPRVSP